jgi:hypothetical protein
MRKLLLLGVAGLLSFVPVTFTVKDATARIGRPGTPFSVAGVHRRHMRRAYGVGWRYGGVAPYRYSYRRVARWHRPFVPYTAGVLPYGEGWNNWHGYPVYPGVGWGAPGYGAWGSGFGFRPGFGFGAPGFGWHRGWW